MTFKPQPEVYRLKTESKLIARKRHKPSKLDPYRSQLVSLRESGASKAELCRWLLRRNVKADWSTVKRWLDKNA